MSWVMDYMKWINCCLNGNRVFVALYNTLAQTVFTDIKFIKKTSVKGISRSQRPLPVAIKTKMQNFTVAYRRAAAGAADLVLLHLQQQYL